MKGEDSEIQPLNIYPPKGSGNRRTRQQTSVRSDTSELVQQLAIVNGRTFAGTLDTIIRDWSRNRMTEAIQEGAI